MFIQLYAIFSILDQTTFYILDLQNSHLERKNVLQHDFEQNDPLKFKSTLANNIRKGKVVFYLYLN